MPSDQTNPSIKRRSPILAAFLSGIFPGFGQFYNRERRKAVLFFGAGIVAAFPFGGLDVDIDLNDPAAAMDKLLLATLPFLVIALWSVVDAYRRAKRATN
ncbi:MAG TPA: hypothetical protein VL403_02945 [Candidatus Kryptonia bacterium]|nr:hypothetical protein [Candidatus Kryptonia bacterium]